MTKQVQSISAAKLFHVPVTQEVRIADFLQKYTQETQYFTQNTYFPIEAQAIFKLAAYFLGSIPFDLYYEDTTYSLVHQVMIDLGFLEIFKDESFHKEDKKNTSTGHVFISSAYKSVVFVKVGDDDTGMEFMMPSQKEDDTDKVVAAHLFYDKSMIGTEELTRLIEKLNSAALYEFKLKAKKNSINFLCYDHSYRLRNVKIKRKIESNLELNYGPDFLKVYDYLMKFLESDETGLVILHGEPGVGKCLAEGTPVMMYDGNIKRVEDIILGDLLMGPDSKPKKVLSLGQGEEEMFRISPVKGDSYTVNKSHILSLKVSSGIHGHKHGDIVNLSVADILLDKNKNYLSHLKTWRTGVEFLNNNDIPIIDPYFLGIWLGDGTSSESAVTTQDIEVVEFLEIFAKKMGLHIRKNNNNTGKATTYFINTGIRRKDAKGLPNKKNPIHNIFRELNILNNKHIPHRFLTSSRETRLQLLAGLLDSDGFLSGSGYEITTVKPQLAKDILFLCRSLGFAAYLKKRHTKCKAKGYSGECDSYRISISGDLSIVPLKIKYKQAAKRRQVKSVLVSDIKIDPIGIGKYFGFELDGDGLFLLGDFTVTHNTSFIRYLLSVLSKRVIYIPPHLVNRVAEPDFLNFLLTENDFILVIEDAEEIITNRQDTNNTAGVSNLLNLSDGILGDCIKVKIIATFNAKIDSIDPALLRKGRLKIKYEFGKLEPVLANKLLAHLNINHITKEAMSLCDIYKFQDANLNKEKPKEVFGFGK